MKISRLLKFIPLTVLMALGNMPTAQGQQVSDVLLLSQYNYGFGTARSAAMGGAFTSLGADLSSMNINPAGLGMYRSSEISITPRVMISSSKNNTNVFSSTEDKTRFGINNGGGVVTLFPYSSSSALKSYSFGFSYNRMADFNSVSYSRGANTDLSIADLFAYRLNYTTMNGIPEGSITTPSTGNMYQPYFNHDPYYWGAILAYQTFLLNADPNDDTYYSVGPFLDAMGNVEVPGALWDGDMVSPSQRIRRKGGVDEYSISAAFNINNVIYFGATIGIQDFHYREISEYMEDGIAGNIGDLQRIHYLQSTRITGTGTNFKFGVTARPIDGLRLGVAVHTPTFSSISEEYYADMSTSFIGSGTSDSHTPYLTNDYDLNTPTRFLAGISYTFANIGVLSVDYERAWYNKMKVSNSYYYINDEIRADYKASNTIKVGAEVLVHPMVSLRAGYAHYGSPLDYGIDKKYGTTQNISGGIGFRYGAFFADLAYINMNYKGAPYRYYYEYFTNGDTFDNGTIVTPETKRHNIILTLGAKF